MTDYLRRALEQDEEEGEETLTEDLLRAGIETGAGLYRGPAADGAGFAPVRRGLSPIGEEGIGKGRVAPSEGGFLGDRALRRLAGRGAEGTSLPLLTALRRAEVGARFARGERRALTVTLPEGPTVAGGLSADELDRLAERDARRYDGGFQLY